MENTGKKNDRLDDKTRWELLPLDCLEDIARVYTEGAKKYGDNNWQNLENGMERYYAASQRHLLAYMTGTKIDPETGCYHLAQSIWNLLAMLWLDKHGKGLDLSKKKTEKFIEKASLIHDNKYDYSKVVYTKTEDKVEIICKEHGSFMQTPHNHLQGAGCPKCGRHPNKRLICGVGVNDLYNCKSERSYNVWTHMLKRCYNNDCRFSAYRDCRVCDKWKVYSNFKKFYDNNCKNDTYHLDKDILVQSNKIYSPATCVFVPQEINECVKSEWSTNKVLPLGVTITKSGKFRVRCNTEVGKLQKHIGVYDTPEEAFKVYQKYKKQRIVEMAVEYYTRREINERTYNALINYKILPYPYGDIKNEEYGIKI